MSNFGFLSPTWPVLAGLGGLAEKNLYIDPNTSLIKLRMFAEILAKYLLASEKLLTREDSEQMIGDYYEEWGWDRKTGIPTQDILGELDL